MIHSCCPVEIPYYLSDLAEETGPSEFGWEMKILINGEILEDDGAENGRSDGRR